MHATVFRATFRRDLEEAMGVLRAGRRSPVLVNDPERYMASGTRVSYLAAVAVPDEQVERARRALAAWESSRTRDISGELRPVQGWLWGVPGG
jgi:hypothetical protein